MAANCFKNANSKVNKILFVKKPRKSKFFFQEKNRFVLRNLSIVTRQLASKITDRTERNRMIEESIQYAKQAVELDVKDGASWCKITFSQLIFSIFLYFFLKIHLQILMYVFILWLKIIQKI
jgi:hypothetical protein